MTFISTRRLRTSRLSLVIGLALGPACAHAQSTIDEASPHPGSDGVSSNVPRDAVTLESVSVTGVRASIQKSLVDKRNAPGIVDAIAAQDMGKFPDLNLSESLQRIPGLTLDRNSNGEGRAINLRGLGPEFTRVEINGMSGVSNGTGGRFGLSEGGRGFNFEIFASELFSKATVYKTGMAEIDEGGLAGTVRLETPRPLDREGISMSASAMANYSETGRNVDPRSAFLFSYNKNDVLGVAASVAYSRTEFVSNAIEAGSWRPFASANTGTRASDEVRAAWNANGPRYYVFNEDRNTLGTTLTLQVRPTDTMTFTLDGLYGKLNSDRMALRDDMAIEGGANIPTDVTIADGIITAGRFTGIQQRVGANFYKTDETYKQITGSLEWTPDEHWTIRPSVGFARREADRRWDLYSFRLANNGVFDPGVVSYAARGNFLDFGSTATNFDSHLENFLFNVFIFRPSRDQDSERQARIDFTRRFSDSDSALKFGLRYNNRSKDRTLSQWRLQRNASTVATAIPNLGSAYRYVDFHVSGEGSGVPGRLLSVNPGALQHAFFPGGQPVQGTYGNSEQLALNLQESPPPHTSSAGPPMQLSFGDAESIGKHKQTRREIFLREMENVVPWKALLALIAPYYPKSGQPGRPPYPLATMLRIHFLQQWYALSDPAMEESLYEIPILRRFAQLGGLEAIPDETTILNFRRLLETHGLAKRLFERVNAHLARKGQSLRAGTIVDATLIAAPSSTKNQEGRRDPQMRQAKKGNQYYFGMKAHIGVDDVSGLVHSVECTSANEADVCHAYKLLHGQEDTVCGDSGYTGLEKREDMKGKRKLRYLIAAKPSQLKKLADKFELAREYQWERRKASLRAKVEHPFRVIKRQFGYVKVRYRGLVKNTAQVLTLFALSNLWMARKRLQPNVGGVRL